MVEPAELLENFGVIGTIGKDAVIGCPSNSILPSSAIRVPSICQLEEVVVEQALQFRQMVTW